MSETKKDKEKKDDEIQQQIHNATVGEVSYAAGVRRVLITSILLTVVFLFVFVVSIWAYSKYKNFVSVQGTVTAVNQSTEQYTLAYTYSGTAYTHQSSGLATVGQVLTLYVNPENPSVATSIIVSGKEIAIVCSIFGVIMVAHWIYFSYVKRSPAAAYSAATSSSGGGFWSDFFLFSFLGSLFH